MYYGFYWIHVIYLPLFLRAASLILPPSLPRCRWCGLGSQNQTTIKLKILICAHDVWETLYANTLFSDRASCIQLGRQRLGVYSWIMPLVPKYTCSPLSFWFHSRHNLERHNCRLSVFQWGLNRARFCIKHNKNKDSPKPCHISPWTTI